MLKIVPDDRANSLPTLGTVVYVSQSRANIEQNLAVQLPQTFNTDQLQGGPISNTGMLRLKDTSCVATSVR